MTRYSLTFVLSLYFYLMSTQSVHAREAIWIEGEAPSVSDFNNHVWYSASDLSLDLLSPGVIGVEEGDWLSHFVGSDGASAEAIYEFEITEEGPHAIWIRANDHSPGNTFQVDADDPQPIPLGQNNESVNLHANRAAPSGGWIDIRFLDWIYLGEFDLELGEHTLTIRCHPATQNNGNIQAHIGLDAITIVNFPWGPAGILKPSTGEPTEPAPDAWYAFHHAEIKEGESEIDLSELIETPSGMRGPLSQVGDEYRFEDGTPVKFWGVGAGIPETVESMQRQARFFRRMGVNLVRLHTVHGIVGQLRSSGAAEGRDFDPERLERLDRYVSILKEQGIYMQWSVFWRGDLTEADGYPTDLYADLPDNGQGGKNPYGVINASRALQDIRWRYLEKLLTHINPYTGLSYAEDPTLAILEVQNEDSIFFHAPLTAFKNPDQLPLHSALFRQQWATWVKNRYQNDEALAAAWGDGLGSGDTVDATELRIYGAWEMNANGPSNPAELARMGDFTRFLAELQREFWLRRREEIRSVGFKGVVLSTGWKAGGPGGRAANLYADSALETIDRHGYWGGFGDTHIALTAFKNDTLLDLDGWYNEEDGSWKTSYSRAFQQVNDLPYGMSEWSHGTPGQFRAEGGPIYAFYGLGLQGWDTSLHFAYGTHTGVSTSWDFLSTYNIANPTQVGQYPALATAVHHGHISQGAPAATRRFTPNQVFSGVDVFTQPGPWVWEGGENTFIPPHIFALGRVSNQFGEDVGPSERSDWNAGWDKADKTVTANTGELMWNYGERYIEVKAGKTQGVIGFAGGKSFDLPDVNISVNTSFVSLLITAMDNQPISISRKVLVTAIAQERWTGSEIEGVGDESLLNALGGPPLMMEPVQAKLTFNAEFTSAEALDVHGRSTGKMVEPDSEGAYHIDGRFSTMYYIFRRPALDPTPPTAGMEITAGMDAGEEENGGTQIAGDEITSGETQMNSGESEMAGRGSADNGGCQNMNLRGGRVGLIGLLLIWIAIRRRHSLS